MNINMNQNNNSLIFLKNKKLKSMMAEIFCFENTLNWANPWLILLQFNDEYFILEASTKDHESISITRKFKKLEESDMQECGKKIICNYTENPEIFIPINEEITELYYLIENYHGNEIYIGLIMIFSTNIISFINLGAELYVYNKVPNFHNTYMQKIF